MKIKILSLVMRATFILLLLSMYSGTAFALDPYETNDTFSDAYLIGYGTYNGYMGNIDDEDFYEFYATAGQEINLTLDSYRSYVDFDIELYDENFNLIGISDTENSAEKIIHVAETTGFYYVNVLNYFNEFLVGDEPYRLVLTGVYPADPGDPLVNTWNSGNGNWSMNAGKSVTGDFNGDGNDDVAVLYGYATQRDVKLFIFLSDGADGFLSPQVWWQAGPGNWDWAGSMLTSGNYNGDNRDDLAILYGYATERETKAWVFTSTPANNFNAPQVWWASGPNNWDWAGNKVVSGDFNGDARDDLATLYGYATERETKAWVFTSTTANNYSAPQVWWASGPNNWDWAANMVESGDTNGDSIDDMVMFYGYGGISKAAVFSAPSSGNAFNQPVQIWNSGFGNWNWGASQFVVGNFNSDNPGSGEETGAFFDYGNSTSSLFLF